MCKHAYPPLHVGVLITLQNSESGKRENEWYTGKVKRLSRPLFLSLSSHTHTHIKNHAKYLTQKRDEHKIAKLAKIRWHNYYKHLLKTVVRRMTTLLKNIAPIVISIYYHHDHQYHHKMQKNDNKNKILKTMIIYHYLILSPPVSCQHIISLFLTPYLLGILEIWFSSNWINYQKKKSCISKDIC